MAPFGSICKVDTIALTHTAITNMGAEVSLRMRITIDPEICHGKPCIRGLRYPVTMILDLLGSGMTWAEIIGDYPDLETDDIKASLFFAKHCL